MKVDNDLLLTPHSVAVKARPLILLAEDNKLQARMISDILKRYHFEVEAAPNGEVAYQMFRKKTKYDLVMLVEYIWRKVPNEHQQDLNMPVMDGPSCVKQIREFEAETKMKRTPIIIQTGLFFSSIFIFSFVA
jgi:CheY-like chemotaxis protein